MAGDFIGSDAVDFITGRRSGPTEGGVHLPAFDPENDCDICGKPLDECEGGEISTSSDD